MKSGSYHDPATVARVIGLAPLCAFLLAAEPHPITDSLPGPDSPSTKWVLDHLTGWTSPPPFQPGKDANPLTLECLVTPGHSDTVGVRQEMVIAAPLATVASVVEDFDHYAQLFPDLEDVHRVKGSEDGNRFLVFWEQHVPVFFIPNVRFQMGYLIDRSAPDKVRYRYKLKEKGTVRASDGLIVLEAVSAKQTRYIEIDFIDADFSPLSNATAWKQSLSGIYRSDVALKLKAEQPGRGYEKLRADADQLLERFPIEPCYTQRHPRAP